MSEPCSLILVLPLRGTASSSRATTSTIPTCGSGEITADEQLGMGGVA
jgi:hypothetical protein